MRLINSCVETSSLSLTKKSSPRCLRVLDASNHGIYQITHIDQTASVIHFFQWQRHTTLNPLHQAQKIRLYARPIN